MMKWLNWITLVCATTLMMSCSAYQNVMFGRTETRLLPAGNKLVTAAWKGQDLWILTRPIHEGDTLETYEFYPLITAGGLLQAGQTQTEGKVILKEVR